MAKKTTNPVTGVDSGETADLTRELSKIIKLLKSKTDYEKESISLNKSEMKEVSDFTKKYDLYIKDEKDQSIRNRDNVDKAKSYNMLMGDRIKSMSLIKENVKGIGTALGFSQVMAMVTTIGAAFVAGGLLMGPFILFSAAVLGVAKIFQQLSGNIAEMSKQIGVGGSKTQEMSLSSVQLEKRFRQVGLTIEDANQAAGALAQTFFNLDYVTPKTQETVARIAVGTRDTAQNVSKTLDTFMLMQGSSFESAENIYKMGVSMASAANVPIRAVMADLSSNSALAAKYGGQFTKETVIASIMARKIGLSFADIASAADKSLDIENSVNAQFEASVLLGRELNMEQLRYYALRGNILGVEREQLKLIGTEREWTKLNTIQRQALADALGLSVDKVGKMVSRREEALSIEQQMLNLQTKQSDSWNNILPKLGSVIGVIEQLMGAFVNLGYVILKSIGIPLEDINKKGNTVFTSMIKYVNSLAKDIQILGLWGAIKKQLTVVWKNFKEWVNEVNWKEAWSAFFDMTFTVFSGLADLILEAINFDGLSKKFEDGMGKIDLSKAVSTVAGGIWDAILVTLQFAIGKAYPGLLKVVKNILNKIQDSTGIDFSTAITNIDKLTIALVAFSNSLTPLFEIISRTFEPLIKLGAWVWKNLFEGAIKMFAALITGITGFVDIIVGIFTLNFEKIWGGIKNVIGSVGNMVAGIGQTIGSALFGMFAATFVSINALFGDVFGKISKFASDTWDYITLQFQMSVNILKKHLSSIGEFFSSIFSGISSVVSGTFAWVSKAASDSFDWIKGALSSTWSFIKDMWSSLLDVLAFPFVALGTLINDTMMFAWNTIQTTFNSIVGVFDDFIGSVKNIGTVLFDILSWPFVQVKQLVMDTLNYFTSIIGKVFGEDIEAAIRNAGDGIISAIKSPFVAAWDFLFGNTVWDYNKTKDVFVDVKKGMKDGMKGADTDLTKMLDVDVTPQSTGFGTVAADMKIVADSIKYITVNIDGIKKSFDFLSNVDFSKMDLSKANDSITKLSSSDNFKSIMTNADGVTKSLDSLSKVSLLKITDSLLKFSSMVSNQDSFKLVASNINDITNSIIALNSALAESSSIGKLQEITVTTNSDTKEYHSESLKYLKVIALATTVMAEKETKINITSGNLDDLISENSL